MRWRRRRGRHWQGEPVADILARLDVLLHARMPDGSLLLWPGRPRSEREPLADLFTDTYHLPMSSFIRDEVVPVRDAPEYSDGLRFGWRAGAPITYSCGCVIGGPARCPDATGNLPERGTVCLHGVPRPQAWTPPSGDVSAAEYWGDW